MPRFRYVGEVRRVFTEVQRRDGSTLEVDPGEEVNLPTDPQQPLLVPIQKSRKDEAATEATAEEVTAPGSDAKE